MVQCSSVQCTITSNTTNITVLCSNSVHHELMMCSSVITHSITLLSIVVSAVLQCCSAAWCSCTLSLQPRCPWLVSKRSTEQHGCSCRSRSIGHLLIYIRTLTYQMWLALLDNTSQSTPIDIKVMVFDTPIILYCIILFAGLSTITFKSN